MAIDDIFEFKIKGTHGGQPIQQVIHYLLFSATGGELDMQAALTALDTKWTAGLRALLSVDYLLNSYTFQLVALANSPLVKGRSLLYEKFIELQGQVTGDSLPPQCALYAKWYGVSSNHLYLRGAKYFGGIPEAHQEAGLMGNVPLNGWFTFFTSALTDVAVPGGSGGTLRPVIWSKKRYKANQIPYLCVINNFSPEASIKTQRRRTLATSAGGH